LLKVDGEWGRDTTTATQKVFGTIVDGEVSHQTEGCRKYLGNCLTASWEFDNTGKGSQLIRAIQTFLAKLGYYKGKIDGLCGKKTVMAMQYFLNDHGFACGIIDGEMGPDTVKAWQKYINSRL
jgi:peptidoglycan hydrolase-like protein with peptidoglycan-binding domain